MSATDDTGIYKSMNVIPEYQERYLKDLLSNVYNVELDDAGNPLLDADGQPIVSGIAADSPLYGTPVLDADGNQMFETDPNTGEQMLDFRGQPIPMVEGGVRRPDVAPLTPNQLEAIRLGEEGVGAFSPMFDQAQQSFGGVQLDADGNPVLDAEGQPIRTGAIGQIGTGIDTLSTGVDTLTGTDAAVGTDVYDPYFQDFTTDVIGDTATDVGTASTGIGSAATTGAAGIRSAATGADILGEAQTAQTGMRAAGAGIAGQVSGAQDSVADAALGARGQAGAAQTGADTAAARARQASAQAQRDLSGAGAFGLGAAAEGMGMLDSTTGSFDPQGIGAFMNQYEDAAVQQAIQDVARAGEIQRNQLGAQAVGAGAFGGSREGVAAQELGRNILEQQGRTAAGMRQAGYESAAQRAQQAFESTQGRGQTAAQLTGQLGQAGADSAMRAAQAGGQLGLSAEELAQSGAIRGGQLGLSAEQLAQTGALQGGQLGLSGQNNLANILQQAGAMGVSAEEAAARLGMSSEQAASALQMQGAGQQADLSMGLAGLRGSGFEMSQQLGQSAFEDEMRRGQSAAQIFGTLGQGMGTLAGQQSNIGTRQAALGEAAQQAGQSDVNSLFNIGALEQGQMQSEYDVQRQADMEEAYEPFQRFNYMSDIFRGVPSTQSTMSVTGQPAPSPVSTVLGLSQGIGNYQNAGGQGIFSGLGV